MITYSIGQDQIEKLVKWQIEQDKKVAEKQQQSQPYYGCSGGPLTYSFTPTTLGMVIKVINNLTKEEIDLTDYSSW